MAAAVRIGTAGWSIPRAMAAEFPGDGTHLQRYARALSCAEINSTFHRRHAAGTYLKWASSVPAGFRFAVKLPRTMTHDQRLMVTREALQGFVDEIAPLGAARGPLLVQLPPTLALDAATATRFFTVLRSLYRGPVACEPRHPSWVSPEGDAVLVAHEVARVAADPARAPGAERPGGWPGLVYYRLHGTPRTYYSRYEDDALERLAAALRAVDGGIERWCIFDNTASGAALDNAWTLVRAMRGGAGPPAPPAPPIY